MLRMLNDNWKMTATYWIEVWIKRVVPSTMDHS